MNDSSKTRMIPLTVDYMFKKVFMENPEILKKMLISILKIDINPEMSELIFLNTELPKTKKREYKKTVDILVSIDKVKIIDIEINTKNYALIKERNTFYIEKITTLEAEKNIYYKEMNNYCFYQLNLNTSGKENYFEDKIFTLKEEKTNEALTPNIKIYMEKTKFPKFKV